MKKILLGLLLVSSLFADIKVGDKAIGFDLKDLNKEKSYTLEGLKGQVVLLNIWASWCSGCKAEMPEFFELQKEYKDGFQLVAISIDKKPKDAKKFLAMVEKKLGYETPFIVLHDKKKSSAKAYKCVGMPSSYLIDKNGVIQKIMVGSLDEEKIKLLKADINKLLK